MSIASILLLLAGPAWAQEEVGYAQTLDQAKAAILAADFKSARALLARATGEAPANAALITARDLARLDFYKGVVEWRAGDKDVGSLDFWRAAITLSDVFAPEPDVLPESDDQDVFYALTGEVKGRDTVVLGLPEDPGDTVIFVDGRKLEAFDSVLLGTHFVQLRCAEGNLVGSWHTFGPPPPDYLALCSGGSYPLAKGQKAPKPPKQPSAKDLAKAEKAAADKAAAEKAAADKVVADKAAAEKAAADKVVAEKAAVDKVAADKVVAEKAAADKLVAEKAAADKLVAEKATADKAAAEKMVADKAVADKAAAEKMVAEKAAADKAAAEKMVADKAAADKAAAEKVVADKAVADKAAAEKVVAQTAADKVASDKAAAEKSAAQAAADKVATDKAAADKAASEKSAAQAATDKAATDKAVADKAASEKLAAKAAADKAAAQKRPVAKKEDSGLAGWVMIAGGGAMIAGGGVVNFLVVNPAFAEVEAANATPGSIPRVEAEAIVSRFNSGRYATIGLIAAGAATAGVGVFLGPLDSHLIITPTGIGLAGRW